MKNILKKAATFIIATAIIIQGISGITASASTVDLPPSTPLAVKTAIADGEIDLTDELLRKLQICDALYNGFYSLESSINLSEFKIKYATEFEMLNECINCVLNNSDLFHAKSGKISIRSSANSKDEPLYCTEILVDYLANATDESGNAIFDRELAMEEKIEYAQLAKELADKIPQDISNIEKMLLLYDYIALNFEYEIDYDNESYDAYHFLKNKMGVCDAYAQTYNKVLEIWGIPVLKALSDTDNHAWSIVKIDGNYYHIDCTWSDPLPDRSGKVDHNYFLKSTEALPINEEGKGHSDWYVNEAILGLDISCDSKTFDSGYLWSDASSAFGIYNGEYYYIDDLTAEKQAATTGTVSAVIRKTKDFKTAVDVKNIDTSAWLDTSGRYVLSDYNSGLYMIGSQIYYNDRDTLMYYDVKNGSGGTVFKVENSNITYFNYCGNGKFQYNEFSVVNFSAVFTKKEYSLSDMGSISNNETTALADDLICMRKYLYNEYSTDLCLLKGDVSSDDGKIDVRDLVALKKLAIM